MSERDVRALEDLLFDLRDLIETARTMPMSASVLVNRDEALAVVEEALSTLPEELRRARWLLKEREEFPEQARRDSDAIVEAARTQAERMVERTEIAREARRIAQKTVDDADAQARRLRLECEDYIDHKLAEFEVVLERTRQAVENGRAQLQVTIDPLEPEEPEDLDAGGFFDQDE